jgi:DNA-binding transcriptional ArsR family regulator
MFDTIGGVGYSFVMDDSLIADRLCALGNETRLKIYRILVRAGHDGVPVSALQRRTGVAMSTVSHHLHRLIMVGLVYQEREGTTLFCHANYQAMDETLGSLTKVCCVDAKGRAEDAA